MASWGVTYAVQTRGGDRGIIAQFMDALNGCGAWVSALVLRLWLAWEFWESGVMKLRGENWFADIMDQFPPPLNIIPTDLSWQLATWFELLGAVGLVVGLGTRFWAVSLSILTVVAWNAVHAGNGYNVCDNGWKLPLIYLVAFVPLFFSGPGKLSVDAIVRRRFE